MPRLWCYLSNSYWNGIGIVKGVFSSFVSSYPCDAMPYLTKLIDLFLQGIFLPKIETARVIKIYHSAQFELLSEYDFGFKCYFLNPGTPETRKVAKVTFFTSALYSVINTIHTLRLHMCIWAGIQVMHLMVK